MTCKCPTCGAPLPDFPLEVIKSLAGHGMQRALIDLVARRPNLLADQLAEHLYADDPDGGPEAATSTIRVVVSQTNRRIASQGWKIEGRGKYIGYRFERLPA